MNPLIELALAAHARRAGRGRPAIISSRTTTTRPAQATPAKPKRPSQSIVLRRAAIARLELKIADHLDAIKRLEKKPHNR